MHKRSKESNKRWNKYKYVFLFVVSVYKSSKTFKKYKEFFEGKNVEVIYFFPYITTMSSTQLCSKILNC